MHRAMETYSVIEARVQQHTTVLCDKTNACSFLQFKEFLNSVIHNNCVVSFLYYFLFYLDNFQVEFVFLCTKQTQKA